MNKKFTKFTTVLISALLLSSLFVGCTKTPVTNSTTSTSTLKPVTLKFYFFGDKKSATDEVWKAIAAKYKDKLNVTFDVSFIAGNDYAQKLVTMAASGDDWDLNFDGDWLSYSQMTLKNAYLPLNTLLPKYAPDLYAAYKKQGTLTSATVGGNIVGLPWTMSMNQRPYFGFRKDLTDKEGLNIANDSIKTVEELDAALMAIKKANPTAKILENTNKTLFYAKYNLAELPHNYVIDLNDPSCKVVPFEQTPAYQDLATYAKKWQDAQIIWKDVLTDTTDRNQMLNEGKLLTNITNHEWAFANRGYKDPTFVQGESLLYPTNKYSNRTALANVVAINKNSKNPERTLMFLNLVQTDKTMYDMVQYGIEGTTYTLAGDVANYPTGMTSATSNYMEWGGQWALWKPAFMRPNATYGPDFWNKEATFAAQPINVNSPLDGFNFDTTQVKNQVAQRDQIFTDNDKLINVGIVKSTAAAAVTDLVSQEKKAGVDEVTSALQKQVDAFLATKKK